jgi:gliding motility-associated-like protein
MKCSSLFFIFCLSTLTIFAQKQANVWHFGNGQALDFSTGNPVQIGGSLMETFEGSASYSDSLGNLLFYTNGGGREPLFSGQDGGHIWNRNNVAMYDMQGTEGGGFSAAQSSVIFEAPGQQGLYYVFTMEEIEYNIGASPSINATQPLGRGLRYFTVDMNLNLGLGDVVLADQPVYLPSYEGLCAIRHSNKRDYWILINQDSTGIGVYSVTPSGVSFVNNYTAIGGNGSIIKASPNGRKVRTVQHLLDFDNSNGTFSNPLLFTNPGDQFEFAPNSRYLYEISNFTVFRYDLNAPSILASATQVGIINVGFGTGIGQMQLGPDGRIYYLTVDLGQGAVLLNRINCPNTSNAAIQPAVLSLTGQFFGLPNFPAWLFENNDSLYVSLGADTLRLCAPGQTYTLDAQNPGASYLWSTGATTQSISVNQIGTYSVTVTGSCGTGVDEVVVSTCAPVNNDNCLVFEYTGAPQQWTVPVGVDSIRLKMWGAAGGGGPDATNNAGGGGGYTEITVPVIAGDVLQIVVGGGGEKAVGHTGGAGGYGGGGDGGTGNRVETLNGIPTDVGGAGGGGGLTVVRMIGSINNILGMAGAGGGASFNRSGGGGGGLNAEYTAANNQFNLNGFGGTQTAGGAPSSNTLCGHPVSGTAGAGQQGGTGATDLGGSADRTGGGGGGAGYFGGGGGGSHDGCFGVGSTGGGGSGFVCSTCPGLTGTTQTAGFFGVPANSSDPLLAAYPGTATGVFNQNGGNGIVQICYLLPCAATTDSISITACNDFTNPLGAIFTQSGIYSYTLTSSTGCDSVIILDLTIIPFSQTQLNVTECDSFTDVNGNTYYQSTIFNYTLVGSNGCDSIISVNLTIGGIVQAPTQNVSVCDSYTAPWGSTYTQSGTYSDTIFTAGCDSLLTINLDILESPTVSISGDSSLCSGETITLNALAGNTQSYLWSDGSTAAQLIVSNGGTYSITVENSCGQAVSSITVAEEDCDTSACEFLIPNAFTPNGDGTNDNWYIQCIELYPDNEVQIFNRWGQPVFTKANYAGDWDGTFAGQLLPDAAYYYILKITLPAPVGPATFTGSVSIIR